MKIAMFGHKRIPSREGGVEIVVEELAKREAALGNDVIVYNRKGHHVSGSKFDVDNNSINLKNVKIKTVFTFQNSKLNAIVYSLLSAIRVSFSRCDVVHIHAEGPAFFCWIPKLFGKRVISTRMCRSKDLYSLSVNRQKSKNRTLFSTTAEFWWRRRFTDLTVRL